MENWDEPENSFEEKFKSAVYKDNVREVRSLLKIRGLETFEDGGYQFLVTALTRKCSFLACMLINAGASLNTDDKNASEYPLIHLALNNRTILSRNNGEKQKLYESGSLEVLKLLLEKNCEMDAINPHQCGETALASATSSQDFEAMNLLLKYGAKVDVPNSHGKTPLYIAILNSYIPGIALLEEIGADVTFISQHGSLLHVAVSDSDNELMFNLDTFTRLMSNLLDEGLSINVRDHMGQTPLHISKSLVATQLLLKNNCDIDAQDANGETPLMIAVKNNRRKIIGILLNAGANPNLKNFQDETCLYMAVQMGNDLVVSTLLGSGVDLRVTCKGESILMTSLKTSYGFITSDLHNSIITSWDNDNQLPVTNLELLSLMYAQSKDSSCNKHLEFMLSSCNFTVDDTNDSRFIFKAAYLGLNKIVEKFLFAGSNVHSVRRDLYFGHEAEYSLLQIAVLDTNPNLIQILLNQGADINVKDERGFSLLHMALLKVGSYHSIMLDELFVQLIQNGIDVHAESNDGYTVLHLASYAGVSELVENLVENHQVDVNKKTKNDVTALHLAVREGWSSVVTYLVENGANANIKMEGGLAPLSIATLKDRPNIAKTLLRHGVNINSEDSFGRDALKIAVWNNSVYYVEELLQFGANPYLEDYKGRNSRELACTYTNYYARADEETGAILEMFAPTLREKLSLEVRDCNGDSCIDHGYHALDYVNCSRYCRWLDYYPSQIPDVFDGHEKCVDMLKRVLMMEIEGVFKVENKVKFEIQREMLDMYLDKVAVRLTVLDIITEPVVKLAMNMKKLKGFRNLKASELDEKYPIFKGLLRQRLAEIQEYERLSKAGMEALGSLVKINIPVLVADEISCYLENCDFRRLVGAANMN